MQCFTSPIINVTSYRQQPINFDDVMLRHYDPMQAYSQSKLANVMFTFDLAERLKDQGIRFNCLNPGSRLNTKMVREMFGYRGTVQSGADVIIHVATSAALEDMTGKYFDQMQETQANEQAYDRQARQKLWQLSESLCNL